MPVQPYLIRHGASWVTPDGRVIHLQGFHDAWLKAHSGITSGAKNTAEFVRNSGWASAVLHEEGYLEIIVREYESGAARDFLWNMLKANEGELRKIVVMPLGGEGYILLSPADLADREIFEKALKPAL
ncbi:MAG: hypothetical protein ABFC75_00680 [Rectinema sp.]